MRLIRALTVALVGAAFTMSAASGAYAQGAGCTALNGLTIPLPAGPFSLGPVPFNAGDTLTFTNTVAAGAGTTVTFASPVAVVSAVGSTVSGQVLTTAAATLSGTAVGGGGDASFIAIVCVAGTLPSGAVAVSTIGQTINNAQAAIQNGQQAMQTYNDWVSKAVMGSFGLGGSSGGTASARLATDSARAKVRRLQNEEQALTEELAENPSATTRDDLESRRTAVRRDLMYARSTADLAAAPSERNWRNIGPSSVPERERSALTDSLLARERLALRDGNSLAQRETPSHDGLTGLAPRQSGPSPTLSFNSRDLIEFCDTADGLANAATDALGRKWNVWLEGRVIGLNDSLAQSNALGLIGSAGVDYKFVPWLAVGLSVGVEGFETKFGNAAAGVRSGSFGVTATPYVGIRLDHNIFASAFVGVSTVTYNTNPTGLTTARFDALRLFVGGALTGVWREGAWRFQPTLSGTYGNEQQYGYTDSAGNVVGGQTVTYGRVSAGPEVGYAFAAEDKSWMVEPFVLAKANLDFASSNVLTPTGQSVLLRPGTLGSGSAGAGVGVRLESGAYFRLQASYDSIGVSGLDVWSGTVRGGFAF